MSHTGDGNIFKRYDVFMPKWNDGIDGQHLKIASHQGKTMRVLAGPGTGKSFALKRRVQRLLEEGKDPSRILAVTFTNVAASALKKDLADIGAPGAEVVKARTLHSLCFEILQKGRVLKMTNRIPRPLMDFEKDFLLDDLMKDFGGKRETEKLLFAYESAFARQQQDVPGTPQSSADSSFKEKLLRWLKLHKAMLIGELVPITLEYLKNNPATEELNQYDFILVDEYQDLNKAEQSLIDLLSQKSELLVVGDDDQSVYSFKHAHPDGIIEFPSTHNPLEDVGLNICRRCPKKVVRLANELMGYLLGEHPKKLEEFPAKEEGEVHATQWNTSDDEVKGVAKIIKKLTSDSVLGIGPEDVLILAPRKQLGYLLRDELQNVFSIRSHTFFQEEALDQPKAQKSYSLLNYIAFPDDRVALRALLGMPTPLSGTYEKLLLKAEELNMTPKLVIEGIKSGSLHLTGFKELIARYDAIEEIRLRLKDSSVDEVLTFLFNPEDSTDIEVILSILNVFGISEEKDIKKLFLKLQGRIRLPEVTEELGFVKIMSLHKSKGLTSRVVFILGCVEGMLPTIKDEQKLIKENKLVELKVLRAEAKRLFFVAITRSKEYLFLSSFRQISFARAKKWGVRINPGRGMALTQASPFFSEVGKHLPRIVKGEDLLAILKIVD